MEAEARRLAQAQAEREAQESARRRAEEESNRTAQDLERIRADRARLESETRRLQELRAREAAEAERKLADAQRALRESLEEKNAEIQRQAALIAQFQSSAGSGPVEATPTESAASPRTMSRVIFSPANYKRANHYFMLLQTESETKE
jgi:DNA repair exonuclease SbcCD ATPase subunit